MRLHHFALIFLMQFEIFSLEASEPWFYLIYFRLPQGDIGLDENLSGFSRDNEAENYAPFEGEFLAPTAEQQFSCCKSSASYKYICGDDGRKISFFSLAVIYHLQTHILSLIRDFHWRTFFSSFINGKISWIEKTEGGERRRGSVREMESFLQVLARSTLCTNVINKKLIICCLWRAFILPRSKSFPLPCPISDFLSHTLAGEVKMKMATLSICFSLLPSECVCVSWCGWHLRSLRSPLDGLRSFDEGVGRRRARVTGGDLIQKLAKISLIFSFIVCSRTHTHLTAFLCNFFIYQHIFRLFTSISSVKSIFHTSAVLYESKPR